jgi:hypothetical protein
MLILLHPIIETYLEKHFPAALHGKDQKGENNKR